MCMHKKGTDQDKFLRYALISSIGVQVCSVLCTKYTALYLVHKTEQTWTPMELIKVLMHTECNLTHTPYIYSVCCQEARLLLIYMYAVEPSQGCMLGGKKHQNPVKLGCVH